MTKRKKLPTPRELGTILAYAKAQGVAAACRRFNVQGSAVHVWLRKSRNA